MTEPNDEKRELLLSAIDHVLDYWREGTPEFIVASALRERLERERELVDALKQIRDLLCTNVHTDNLTCSCCDRSHRIANTTLVKVGL